MFRLGLNRAFARLGVGSRRRLGLGVEEWVPQSVVLSLRDDPGALRQALMTLDHVNLSRIESFPRHNMENRTVNIHLEFAPSPGNSLDSAVKSLENCTSTLGLEKLPWFPRSLRDLDKVQGQTFQFGAELDSDHPGFLDNDYRRRRKMITEQSSGWKTIDPVPTVNYTKRETETWKAIYTRMDKLRQQYACKEFLTAFKDLEEHSSLSADEIPQLQTISESLQKRTGWSIKPVSGLVSPRNFLNALAVKVFHSTQYIRHYAQPLYTPEPDICHEVLGEKFNRGVIFGRKLSQEIGLASLGASDEDIARLAKCYWFTVEFGLCRELGELKAYGAGVLSSCGEIQHACEGQSATQAWDPFVASETDYPITQYQPLYFVATDFQSAKEEFKLFVKERIRRPFHAHFDSVRNEVQLEWLGSHASEKLNS